MGGGCTHLKLREQLRTRVAEGACLHEDPQRNEVVVPRIPWPATTRNTHTWGGAQELYAGSQTWVMDMDMSICYGGIGYGHVWAAAWVMDTDMSMDTGMSMDTYVGMDMG